jgi:DNA-binding NarL/FixJ family response regulator
MKRPEQTKTAMPLRAKGIKPTHRSGRRESGPTPTEPAYWESRLLRSTFTAEARPGSDEELFVRFEREGHWVYFPLETNLSSEAARRACEIHRLLVSRGWKSVSRQHVRQIIWAIFWFREPLTCTYATLFTSARRNGQPSTLARQTANCVPLALIETEPEVLRGLEQGLSQTSGYVCVQSARTAKELLERGSGRSAHPRLVLFNERSLDMGAEVFQNRLQARWPGAIAVPFGIYGHSDELFITIHGMEKGYFLRRRVPARILEPLDGFWQSKPATPSQLRVQVQGYFQKLVLSGNVEPTAAESGSLTQRESEILRYLGAGHTDKTISAILGISAWTVHAHVKSIFEKLGVHTRAEAVMRYMQK